MTAVFLLFVLLIFTVFVGSLFAKEIVRAWKKWNEEPAVWHYAKRLDNMNDCIIVELVSPDYKAMPVDTIPWDEEDYDIRLQEAVTTAHLRAEDLNRKLL